MRQDIIDKLMELTDEEKEILEGNHSINQSLYTDDKQFIIDSKKILSDDQLINIRKHTRFIEFPAHKHNYIEFNYVYKGKLTEIIHNKKITLEKGEIIFLNKDIIHSIEKSSNDDIIINFIIKPEFFDFILNLSESDNIIFSFLLKSIYLNKNNKGEYLYFKVSDEKGIQEILEKIIIEIYEPNIMSSTTIKLLVGLLIVELIKKPNNIEVYSEDNYDNLIMIEVLKYIDKNYTNATLFEIAKTLKQPHYKISKLVKKQTNMTFKELLQEKRLNKAKQLLNETDISVVEIIYLVGYENLTYFYKIFKEKYGYTPKNYKSIEK
ncbi:MAG: helix-turn-helix domain-containing protein [Clostridium sp.]|uniref:AraC family transcriptional regulator n=1 Tax=Clostridium sp. TaxID=1506 RepID=UPI0025BDD92D|nr:AraC family transcriptional regulator [Clostridium sp.]MBS4956167.1 helix-turn-helix domain-containing protein [Clostridium sp.]